MYDTEDCNTNLVFHNLFQIHVCEEKRFTCRIFSGIHGPTQLHFNSIILTIHLYNTSTCTCMCLKDFYLSSEPSKVAYLKPSMQSLPYHTWPVGGPHDEHLFPRLQPVHLCQQLVDDPHTGATLGHSDTTIRKPQPRHPAIIGIKQGVQYNRDNEFCYKDDFSIRQTKPL